MGIAEAFQRLNDAYGINLSIVYDPFDRDRFLHGLRTTIAMSLVCMAFSAAIGIAGAWLLGARSRAVRRAVTGYVEAFRNTPPLIQLLFFFFAVSPLLPGAVNSSGQVTPLIGGLGWAVISFSLYAGALNVEIFRAGVEAVPAATREAAEALGYTRAQTFRQVVLPLAFRISLPAFNNNMVNLIKTTNLAYAIGVPELLYASASIWSESFNVREMMLVILAAYLLLVGGYIAVMRRVERALRMPGTDV
ncbi:MAG TPA: amino acid ABC transporter permease [Stellaceae bacterium]|nr:amino acid ABC transporter permease [Stellaceae bacterium]